MVKVVPCLAVIMSSLTIMVIAVDRHRVICKPTFKQVKKSFTLQNKRLLGVPSHLTFNQVELPTRSQQNLELIIQNKLGFGVTLKSKNHPPPTLYF